MKDRHNILRSGSLSARTVDLLLVGLVFVAYSVTIAVALQASISASIAGGVANTVPVVIFGALTRQIIRERLVGLSPTAQIAGHVVLGAAFTLMSYWLLVVLLGLVNGISLTEFAVKPFATSGTAWQMLETVTTYGIIAALSYIPIQPHHQQTVTPEEEVHPEQAPAIIERRDSGTSHYFIRSGDDLRPIDFERIISVAGADDYAEITSQDGIHLVRMTLAELEKTLDPTRFARVHRSSIVNVGHILRAEPAGGGRLLLHMSDGRLIPASRTGTRLLRDRVI
ncbi:LytTR family transcriptional regulator [Porphyrobacter algicida]|uniref:LytTR family transcriptional regulator n=1 Tax=Qipengyuania algicida TaxID=1836209 RepID=A0A845AHG1_9SPHN|nr:LytTR family DNA-binding domain-containing protein [Qipengyuania algicida]MXP28371.1 LytTR family transcriptional regulator [Qipengyuania algicida]